MKKTITLMITLACGFALPMAVTSCGDKKEPTAKVDTADSLTDEVAEQMTAIADALAGAKDKASAEDAVKKVNAAGDALLAIAKRMEAIEAPDEKKRAELEAKMTKVMDGLDERMTKVFKTLGTNEEVMAVIGPAMMDFEKKMKPVDETFKKFGKKDD